MVETNRDMEKILENEPKISKKDEEKTVEIKEGNREEFELFKKEADELKKEQYEAKAISYLTDEGGEELIKIYGMEKFIEAIGKAKTKEQKRAESFGADSNGRTDMYEIIKILEPDKGKRVELYKEMKKLNENSIKNFDEEDVVRGSSEKYSEQAKVELCNAIVDRFESIDRLSDLTLKNLFRIPKEIGNEYEYIGLIPFEDINTDDLSEQLEKYNNDILALVADKNNVNEEKTKELIIKKQELINNLTKEIEEIREKANIEYFKKDNELFKELEDFSLAKPIVESGKKFVDDKVALIKKNIEENYKNTKKEIFKKTKEQRKLIEEAEKLVLTLPIFR